MQRFVLGLSISLAAISSTARAGEIVHSANAGPVPVGGTSTVTLPAFDANLGVLRRVVAVVTVTVSGTLSFENTNATPTSIGGFFGPHGLFVQVPSVVAGLGLGPAPYAGYSPPVTSLAAYDGTIDYAGASGITFQFANEVGQFSGMSGLVLYEGYYLQAFTGANPIPVVIGPVFQTGPGSHAGLSITEAAVAADTNVSLRYEYDPFPAQICGTTWTSGCPCDNHSITGVDGGCRNSASSSGRLLPSGSASLANDTLTLYGGGMTNSSSLYFQGTNIRYAQAVYGDGLMCVAGTIRRLGTRANVGDSSQYPGPGGTPISVVGAISSPGTRYYQIVYRDLGNFCTPSTFNTTSGMAIVWSL